MNTWVIEIVTNGVLCNTLELDAETVIKVDHHNLVVDDVWWRLPVVAGLSFADVSLKE